MELKEIAWNKIELVKQICVCERERENRAFVSILLNQKMINIQRKIIYLYKDTSVKIKKKYKMSSTWYN